MMKHWADDAAKKLIQAHPEQERFVVAAGITPSGVVHVGNFREVITSEFVRQALTDAGKDVRFIFSWDDFDVFRKVPEGFPGDLSTHLRRSVCDVPDPNGQSDSYAGHFIERFEKELAEVGIAPEFIRQSRRYRAGAYAAGIRTAIEKRDELRAVLDSFRTEPLAEDWLPTSGFCQSCGRDNVVFRLDGDALAYRCGDCGFEERPNLDAGSNVKLPWRIDWPMRWAYEKVDFEPGGKDHSSAGGSYDTGKEIVRRIYGGSAPRYIAYEFVLAKGDTKKLSSSSGRIITVSDCLKIYQPEILRWLFARSSPKAELRIAFEADVIQTHEEFDRAVNQARAGKVDTARRALELSRVAHRPSLLESSYKAPSFRLVTTVLQALDGDTQRTFDWLASHATNDDEARWLRERIACVEAWLDLYAPADFVYRVRSAPITKELPELERSAVRAIADCMASNPSDSDIAACLKGLGGYEGLDIGQFFATVYDLLISRTEGPRLSTLLGSIGAERAVALLRPTADQRAAS